MSGAKSITLILFSSSLIHSSKAGGQHRLPSPRSSSVIEHRRAQPLGKQEAAMLLPVCLEKERMFSFCKFPAKRGLRHRENKEFKSFTNPSLAFRSRFLDAWTVFWLVKSGCCLWGMNKPADGRCTGQVDNRWQVRQGAPSEESTPVTSHLPDLRSHPKPWGGLPTQENQVHAGTRLSPDAEKQKGWFGLGKYSQTLLWGGCTRNEGGFSYPGKKISRLLSQWLSFS